MEVRSNALTKFMEVPGMKPEEDPQNAETLASSLEFVKNLLTQAGIDINATDGTETSDGEKPETILDMFIRHSMESEGSMEVDNFNEEFDEDDIQQSALKLFDEAMSYQPKSVGQASASSTKPPKTTTKIDSDYFASSLEKIAANVNAAHAKIRNDASQKLSPDNDISKDVDRLLDAANNVYGHRFWSASEKKEFEKFCRILRYRGSLSNEEKEELKQFYAKAYKLTDIEGTYGERRQAQKCATEQSASTSENAKLAAEKEFRQESIELFGNMLKNEINGTKKRGRPPKSSSSTDDEVSPLFASISDQRQKEKNILRILTKANELNGKHKMWTSEEIQEFEKFYEIFRGKQSFTLQQSKELNAFYKKAYGDFDPYEIAREVDERLQEKKKYWQEYRRNYYLARKAQGIVPSRKAQMKTKKEATEEDMLETRKRKAAYLREWRMRKANEKKIMSMLVEAAERERDQGSSQL